MPTLADDFAEADDKARAIQKQIDELERQKMETIRWRDEISRELREGVNSSNAPKVCRTSDGRCVVVECRSDRAFPITVKPLEK